MLLLLAIHWFGTVYTKTIIHLSVMLIIGFITQNRDCCLFIFQYRGKLLSICLVQANNPPFTSLKLTVLELECGTVSWLTLCLAIDTDSTGHLDCNFPSRFVLNVSCNNLTAFWESLPCLQITHTKFERTKFYVKYFITCEGTKRAPDPWT